jgi:hypothetical protein
VDEGLARWLVEAEHGWRHTGLLPLSILSGPRRFWQSVRWRSLSSSPAQAFADEVASRLLAQPALRSNRSLWLNAVVIPGTSAGRWLCPWPTQIVIPTTLATETGEVSWVSMRLRRVLLLAEVDSRPSKSQDLSSGSEVVVLGVKSHGVSPTVSGRAGSRTEPAGGCLMATSWHPAPRALFSRGLDLGATCPRAAASRPLVSGPPIFCDNRGGCPLLTPTWRMTEEAVASTSWVRCATDPPALAFSLFNRGPFAE